MKANTTSIKTTADIVEIVENMVGAEFGPNALSDALQWNDTLSVS